MARMDTTRLKALLAAEKADAMGMESSALADERSRAMDYYLGDMSEDMPAPDGRSRAVSSDVADTVEGLMPSLMDVFCGGDDVVEFEPVGPEDEEAAQQETDYTNHVFMQKNPGFLVLYTFIKDALLSKTGVVKVFWETEEKEERETYLDLSEDSFAILTQDPEVEVVEHSERPDPMMPEGTQHDVTLVKRKEYGCAKVEAIPPEEFLISRRARSIALATYCAHKPKNKTEADLIAMGYPADVVKKLPSAGENEDEEELARDTVEDWQTPSDNINKAAREIEVTEHYVRMDYEGDGKARLYRITTAADESEILVRDGEAEAEPVDVMPFAAMTPVIVTHRFFGRSIADLVMDIQRIKTALLRGLLDNVYLANNQRIEVSEAHSGPKTLDDILANRPGGVVRTKQPGGILPIPNQPIGDFVYPALEYMDSTREWRTGVTRQGQGIDANALQNQSATAVNQAFTAAQARMKLIARIFAETGVRDMFSLLHATIRKHDKQQNTIRLRNTWVQVDPRQWKTRSDMTISVGLGTGGKEQQLAHLMGLLTIQKEALMQPSQTIVTPKNLYNTLKQGVKLMGLKSVEPYFTDPDTREPPEPPPDPKMIEVQGKLQVEQAKLQMDQQKTVAQGQMDREKMEAEFALKREQMVAEFQLKEQQMHMEFAMKREQMSAELSMKREQVETQNAIARENNVMNAAVKEKAVDSKAASSPVRMGGDPG